MLNIIIDKIVRRGVLKDNTLSQLNNEELTQLMDDLTEEHLRRMLEDLC